jgi:hypothetical protein
MTIFEMPEDHASIDTALGKVDNILSSLILILVHRG